MDRRSFLKFLGISAATAVVAPKMLASEPPQSYDDMMGQVVITMDKMLKEDQYKERIAQENLRAVEQFLLEDKEIPEQLRSKWLKALLKVKINV